MIASIITVAGSYGVWLMWSSLALGWRGLGAGPSRLRRRMMPAIGPRAFETVTVIVAAAAVGGTMAYAVFGAVVPTAVAAGLAVMGPLAARRSRSERRRAEARDAWPRMLEQLRIETGSIGRSIPQAVVEIGRRSPPELRPAFETAEREWRRSANPTRMLDTLATELADPTADVVCETLLVAAEVGGTDLDARLVALTEDRVVDLRHRKDARARQAGVRFARRFVLAVPAGMALAGLSIGTGRDAYSTATGQLLVATGLLAIAGCWVWAGCYLRLPQERRLRAVHPP